MNFKRLLAQSIIWRGFYFFSLLLVNIFLSRYLKAAGAGNLYFLTIIFSFSQVVLGLSIEAGITFFASANIINRNRLIGLAGVWSVAAGVLITLIVYVFFILDNSLSDSLVHSYSIYGFFYVTGQCLMSYITALYYTRENYFLPNFLLAAVNLIYILFIPGMNGHTPSDPGTVIFLYFFTFLLSGFVLFVSFLIKNKKEGPVGLPSGDMIRRFLKYCFTALAANVIFFLVYRIDYLFVNASPVCTAGDLGNYIQVSKLGQMMLIVPQIIASVVFPRTASGIEPLRLSNSIMLMARLFSQLFLAVFIVILVAGQYLFIQVFGPTFNEMRVPMLILIPGIFSLSVLALLSAHFSGTDMLKVNVRGAVFALIVMVTGDFFFVPLYGIVAAAIISTISYTVNLAYSLAVFNRHHDIHFFDFFRWRKEDYHWMKALLVKKNN